MDIMHLLVHMPGAMTWDQGSERILGPVSTPVREKRGKNKSRNNKRNMLKLSGGVLESGRGL